MKFLVTYVTLNQERKRMGKSQTKVIDTQTPGTSFFNVTSPVAVEELFEENNHPRHFTVSMAEARRWSSSHKVKVVDVREVHDEPVCAICGMPGSECGCTPQGVFL